MKYNKYSLILNIMDIIVSIFIILVCCGLTSNYLKYKSLMNDVENNVHFEYKEFDYCFNFKEFILLADTNHTGFLAFRMVSTVCCGVWLELSSQKPIRGVVCILLHTNSMYTERNI